MRYRSTRDSSLRMPFSEVLLGGLSQDGGLYMPCEIPSLKIKDINSLENLSYQELTVELLYPFVSAELSLEEFQTAVFSAYKNFGNKDIVKLIEINEKRWVLELFHGPTLAFKDVAMQLLGSLLEHFSRKGGQEIAVLGATSGDTGSAAIAACSRYKNVKVFILYPHQRVTEVQRLQMTTSQSKNVHALSVRTDFDGCQDIAKQLFLDKDILSSRARFISANSINWTRCMAQSVYYFWTYLRLNNSLGDLIFSVPSGNFGHAYAGWFAKEMGLPIKKIIVATNKNDVLHRLISKNSYKKEEVTQTLAPSMDISVASNFERLLFGLFKNNSHDLLEAIKSFPENEISLSEQSFKEIQDFFTSLSSSDEEILNEIDLTFRKYNYILDPHTATGIKATREIAHSTDPVVSMATAHPAKFIDSIRKVVPEESISIPSQLSSLQGKKELFVELPNNIDKVREYILNNIG